MALHSSLKANSKSRRHRSVLKRFERIKVLKEEGKWTQEDSLFGLPKVKTLKIKMKKPKVVEKPKAAEEAIPSPETPTS